MTDCDRDRKYPPGPSGYRAAIVVVFPRSSPRWRKGALVGAIVANLSLLGFFKYFTFFKESLNALLALRGFDLLPVLRVTLPIGISFYTFQALSYTVDVYRNDARPARSFVDFACFVSLFPQLIAGPIIRYHTVAEQLVYREHTSTRISTFLRDYLYIPLGSNRKGPRRTYVNLATVMLFGGLWHGANWTFVLWGGVHGALLGWERWLGKESVYSILPRPVRVLITFTLVLITWVLFRAKNISGAGEYLAAMFGLAKTSSGSYLLAAEIYSPRHLVVLAACIALSIQPLQAFDWSHQTLNLRRVLCLLLLFLLALVFMSTQAFNPFLYFQF